MTWDKEDYHSQLNHGAGFWQCRLNSPKCKLPSSWQDCVTMEQVLPYLPQNTTLLTSWKETQPTTPASQRELQARWERLAFQHTRVAPKQQGGEKQGRKDKCFRSHL